jgi:hypothetical protein
MTTYTERSAGPPRGPLSPLWRLAGRVMRGGRLLGRATPQPLKRTWVSGREVTLVAALWRDLD